MAEVAQVI